MFENMPSPLVLIVGLTFLSLLPFLAVVLTSYIKLVVVMQLVRNALGVQQIPPTMVINGLAIILSVYIMAPVFWEIGENLQDKELSLKEVDTIGIVANAVKGPVREFLKQHANPDTVVFFERTARLLWPEEKADALKEDDFIVLAPAFAVSELTAAFQIGFLLYLPFVAIDLIVSNILLAMGMMMVSPITISLPFKLLLFVLLEGWTKILQGVVMTYR